jgi:hypothetical protein
MSAPKPPCYDTEKKVDCPNRSATCALTCPRCAEYVKERDAEYERKKILSVAKNSNTTYGKDRAIRNFIYRNSHKKRCGSFYRERQE